jgi:hypothetical protein
MVAVPDNAHTNESSVLRGRLYNIYMSVYSYATGEQRVEQCAATLNLSRASTPLPYPH